MTQNIPARCPWIVPLSAANAAGPHAINLVGGKGANLSRLAQAGFPVPPGFLLTTQAYQDFVQANHLEEQIVSLTPGPGNFDRRSPNDGRGDDGKDEQASQQIRALFSAGTIPPDLAEEIRVAYAGLGQSPQPVAVRSSATAEDLPEVSFAGQQDTYLNVVGADRLLKSVVDCWSSLWTGRAIGYRRRNQVPHEGAALAVVVQAMVESQASGVLFTANPVTGLRSETVIDATLGLGEALVSGQVEPDHYVVARGKGEGDKGTLAAASPDPLTLAPFLFKIKSKKLGAKVLSIHGQAGGGTVQTQQPRADVQALPDEAILELTQLGSRVAELYGFPQDIEWAWADNKIFLLQTRLITSLFPLPEGSPASELKVYFSFAAVQGMLDPLTPLGRDSLRQVFATGGRLFGYKLTRDTQPALQIAGERLWANITPLLRNSIGRKVVPVALDLVEPTIRQAVKLVWDDPRLQPGKETLSFRARLRLAGFILPMAANVLLNLSAPPQRRKFIIGSGERLLETMEAQAASIRGDRWQKLAQQADLLPGFADKYLPRTLLLFISGVAAGMVSWNFLNMLSTPKEGDPLPAGRTLSDEKQAAHDLVLQATRGMPYNPTTEMDLALWDMARTIRQDPEIRLLFQNSPAELAKRYFSGGLPASVQQVIDRFLALYGGRGLGEIDMGRMRWAEDPTHVFEMLSSFLQIEDVNLAPDAVFARGASSAKGAIDQLASSVRKTHRGWFKARLVRFFAGRARQLMGMRENPKFFAVRMMYIIHRELLKSGQEFFQRGELDRADDVFFLKLSELKELAEQGGSGLPKWRELIASRRQAYQRELLRRQIPRLLLSDGRAFYEGLTQVGETENALNGSPVSPGSAQGRVRVVLDPSQAGLLPGEILVCPGTDPSWTPLFMSAAGLVMEVGGMMTHGAVVAREYGIPAIVGVDQATTRLQTGQMIRINGSSGEIEILGDKGS